MKKLMSFIFFALVSLSLVSCGDNKHCFSRSGMVYPCKNPPRQIVRHK